jgi:UDP-2,3-diacylglucosamine pyrophosphatase LpxH
VLIGEKTNYVIFSSEPFMSRQTFAKLKRLSELMDQSERVIFDNQSRLIFFSDIHRGDNTWADEFAQNQAVYSYALKHYLQEGFTYIEVGDGDELMKNGKAQSIHSAHAGIYRTLRNFYAQGRFYYLHGNHDIQYSSQDFAAQNLYTTYHHYQDKTEPLFPDIPIFEGLLLVHQDSGETIFVTHGHQGELLNDRFWKISQLLLRRLWRPLQLLGIQNPYRVSTNPEIRKDIERDLQFWVIENQQALICGHTHCAHFPQPGHAPYFNTGSCVHPRWITGIEIDQGEVMLVRWRIKPDQSGALYVQREVISGPEHISAYFSTESNQVDGPDDPIHLQPQTRPIAAV